MNYCYLADCNLWHAIQENLSIWNGMKLEYIEWNLNIWDGTWIGWMIDIKEFTGNLKNVNCILLVKKLKIKNYAHTSLQILRMIQEMHQSDWEKL